MRPPSVNALRRLGPVLFLPFLLFAAPAGPAQRTLIVLDGSSASHTFDGIGAVSAGASSRLLIDYPEPYRSQILDYLFQPGYGAALQHLKVEIGSDVNSTDGSEPSHMRTPSDHDYSRGYEWWLIREARKRNPHVILDALPWGAPGWIGRGHYYSPDMARYVADFVEGAKITYGLDIAYVGIWNEKQFDPGYVKELSRLLRERHLTTRIVCCDEYPNEGLGQWSIIGAMDKDSSLAEAVDVVGVHYPLVNGTYTTPKAARRSGKPLWSSEDQPNSGGGPFVSREWQAGGRILAERYNRNYLEGGFTATEIWSPITSYYDILAAPHSGLMYANTPWSGHYKVQGTIWATAHTTQFAQPGWLYLDSACGYMPEHGSYVTLKSPSTKDWSVVLETIDAKGSQAVTFKITHGLSAGVVHVWETNSHKTFEHVADLTPTLGRFTYTFDPDSLYSLTTTVGQGKGSSEPPADKSFPFPYSDNFEGTELRRAPRFLSDQNGAFEVHSCWQRSGRCLEQVIADKPIPWDPMPDPFTLAGNVNRSDYQISCDVNLGADGSASVMGRIDSANVFRDGKAIWPSGYVLTLTAAGRWALLSAGYKVPTRSLASGEVNLSGGAWHRLSLKFLSTSIEASLDGKQLAQVADGSHSHGMFALGSGWFHVQFDNLAVTKD